GGTNAGLAPESHVEPRDVGIRATARAIATLLATSRGTLACRTLPSPATLVSPSRASVAIASGEGHGRNLLVVQGCCPSQRFVRQLHRRRCDVDDVEFVCEHLDDDTEAVEVPVHERLAQGRARELETARAKVDQRGQRLDLNALLRHVLDVAQEAMLARLGERDGDAFASGAPSATDPMDVSVGRGGHVV